MPYECSPPDLRMIISPQPFRNMNKNILLPFCQDEYPTGRFTKGGARHTSKTNEYSPPLIFIENMTTISPSTLSTPPRPPPAGTTSTPSPLSIRILFSLYSYPRLVRTSSYLFIYSYFYGLPIPLNNWLVLGMFEVM